MFITGKGLLYLVSLLLHSENLALNDTCLQFHFNQCLGSVLLCCLFSFFFQSCLFVSVFLSFKAHRALKLARSCLSADGPDSKEGKEGMEQISDRDGKIMTIALWVISRYSAYGELGI